MTRVSTLLWPAISAAASLVVGSTRVVAQGCEPIRFTTPVNLGGEGDAYRQGRDWRFTLALRRLYSNQWFVGTTENSKLAPGGQSPVFDIRTAVADLSYAPNERMLGRRSVPYSIGAAVNVLPALGLSASLGGRMDGIPLRDLFDVGDHTTIKRTSRIVFVDPELSLTSGRENLTISVPWRAHVQRIKSEDEISTNGLNAGVFAKYLVFASWSHRV